METNEQRLQKYRNNDNIVFGKKWFELHQNKLLNLFNNPITKRWFRWKMKMSKMQEQDFSLKDTISEVFPSGFKIKIGETYNESTEELVEKFRIVCFSDDSIAKRLYKAFKPVWWTMHALDWVALDRVDELSKLSFGFSTLTVYPNNNAETTSVDGSVENSGNKSWATIRSDASGTDVQDSTGGTSLMFRAERNNTNWAKLMRSFFLFDTSALGSGATISAATLSIKSTASASDNDIGGTWTFNIYTSTPTSNTALDTGDFSQVGTTAQCDTTRSFTDWDGSPGYQDWAFNATGLGNISKTGISKFCMRNANFDVSGTQPGGSGTFLATYITGYYANAQPNDDPKLVITYTIVSGPANLKSYNTNLSANIKSINTNAIANVKKLDTNV